MKKGLIIFLFLSLLVPPSVLAISEERYIVELNRKQINDFIDNNIVEEIESSEKLNQVARARIGLDKKKVVVNDISKETLELEDSVIRLEPDYKVYSLEEPSKWNYEVTGVDSFISGGEGIKIAVLDTGANYNLLPMDSGYDFVNEDDDFFDDNGHGTLVTQILRNPGTNFPLENSEIYSVKVLNHNGEGYVSDVIEGINWAIDNNVNIVLMSFGGEQDSIFLKETLQEAYNQGILIIAAGGNSNNPNLVYPAKYTEVIGVGSVSPNLDKSSFSNYGNDLELVAPGENIILFDGNNYLEVQGTSFSVPHIGIVATGYWSEDLELSNLEIRDKLKNTAVDLGEEGKDDFFGWGLANFLQNEDEIVFDKLNFDLDDYPINTAKSLNDFYPSGIIKGKTIAEYSEGDVGVKIIDFSSSGEVVDFVKKSIHQGVSLKYDEDDPYFEYENAYGWIGKNYAVQIQGLDSFDYNNGLISLLLDLYPMDSELMVEASDSSEDEDFTALAVCSDFGYSSCSNSNDEKREGNIRYECNYQGFLFTEPLCWEPVAVNGNNDFCTEKAMCTYQQFDCDFDTQCLGELDCVDLDGDVCLLGRECGCCNTGDVWSEASNTCQSQQSCGDYGHQFGSCSQDGIQKREGDYILECDDQILFGEFLCWEIFRTLGDGDFCQELTDLNPPLACLHNEYDCDPNNQCLSGLVCDGNTPTFDFQDEGCCFVHENWNTIINSCNDAVKGKIYSVTQDNQNFIESPYSNLKLRVFISEDDIISPDNVVKSFDLFSDSQGNFAFNPEREVSSWNWDAGFLAKYYIHSIYVIEGNEVIGKWTNQFSDDSKYQNAIESVNQIVRIHKDKTTWRKVPEFPEVNPFAGLSLSTQSLNEQSLNIQKPVHLNWNGKLNIFETGEYMFSFNVTGNVKLSINEKEIINSKNNGVKEGRVILTSVENNVTFEFFESGNHNPKVYWQYENGEIMEITEENLIRESTKTVLVDELDKLSSLSFSEVNNQPDYMISFLEKPETLRNQKPLILVHGKHGKSGYWDKGNAQNWFNDLSNGGYDAWEFYYPGDDYINVSGALLGDALDYLKRNNYGSNQKFDIVTHSMGGLVARSYAQNISGYNYKNDVNHLVMIGSPNYGNGATTGIVSDWNIVIPILGVDTSIPYWVGEEVRINGIDWLLENFGNWERDITYSPIYEGMSLGSLLISDLQKGDIPQKSLVIIGNKDGLDFQSWTSFLCSILDEVVHTESDVEENDCIVAIASSSLLNKNVSLAVVSNKNHATEIDEIQDYSVLIREFLNDGSDNILKGHSFVNAYYNPRTNSKKNFDQYDEGSILLRFINSNLIDEDQVTIKNNEEEYKLAKNLNSGNHYHFNRGEFNFIDCVNQRFSEISLNIDDPSCLSAIAVSIALQDPIELTSCVEGYDNVIRDKFNVCLSIRPEDYALTLPSGNYEIYVDNISINEFIQIKPMETTFLAINGSSCLVNIINTSWSSWFNIGNCSISDTQNQSRFIIQYDVNNCEEIQNQTLYEYRNVECSYCEPNIQEPLYTNWGECSSENLKNRTKYYVDNNYGSCCAITELNSDCVIENPEYENITETENCPVSSPGMIISPLNSKVYDSRRIFFNLQANDELDEITYINYEDNRPREKILCRNCESYERTLSLLEGFNNITFKAIENGAIVSQKNIWLFIDSRKPQISKTEPKKGFANGNFKAEIKEENLESVELHHGTDMKEINVEEECSELSGKIVCETEVDLSEYDGQEIEYSFSVEDIAGSIGESRPIKVKVDITSPVVYSFDYILDGRNVNFVFQVTEINFDEINYIDWKDSRPREIRLCSRLRNGICETRKSFRTGEHNLTINILDEAGNFVQEHAEFTV